MSKTIRLVELWDLRTIWADALSCAHCLCLSVPNDIKNCRITYMYVNLSPWAIFPLPAIYSHALVLQQYAVWAAFLWIVCHITC